jgi:hypothetical protein
VSEGADILPFKGKAEPEASPFTPDERAAIMGTIENLMGMNEARDQQLSTLIAVIGELQSHVRDLEHDVARLKKERAKTPAILNAQGARAN